MSAAGSSSAVAAAAAAESSALIKPKDNKKINVSLLVIGETYLVYIDHQHGGYASRSNEKFIVKFDGIHDDNDDLLRFIILPDNETIVWKMWQLKDNDCFIFYTLD